MRIALVGTKQEPRTGVARELERSYNFKVVGMFDALKRFYRQIYYQEKITRVPWEKTYQIYDAIYAIDPEMWIYYMEKRLAKTTSDVVIPDVRYVAELDRLRQLDFTIVRVKHADSVATVRPAKTLMNAGEGTVVVNEYYGKLPVDLVIAFESPQNMRKVVKHMLDNLTEHVSEQYNHSSPPHTGA
jgi:hypothetical protein